MNDCTTDELFWSRVRKEGPDDCWLWTGRRNSKGYGRLKRTMAHRYAYALKHGPIPEGVIIRHRCDVPLCCNPAHLEPGTFKDNSRDCVERKRIAHGESHGRAKITREQALAIRAAKGVRLHVLAKKYGIAVSTVSYIRSGSPKSWKYL